MSWRPARSTSPSETAGARRAQEVSEHGKGEGHRGLDPTGAHGIVGGIGPRGRSGIRRRRRGTRREAGQEQETRRTGRARRGGGTIRGPPAGTNTGAVIVLGQVRPRDGGGEDAQGGSRSLGRRRAPARDGRASGSHPAGGEEGVGRRGGDAFKIA